jgi:hypothetical protein
LSPDKFKEMIDPTFGALCIAVDAIMVKCPVCGQSAQVRPEPRYPSVQIETPFGFSNEPYV